MTPSSSPRGTYPRGAQIVGKGLTVQGASASTTTVEIDDDLGFGFLVSPDDQVPDQQTVHFEDMSIVGDGTPSDSGPFGNSGIADEGQVVTLDEVHVVSSGGAGVFNVAGSVTITDSVLSKNDVGVFDLGGGGTLRISRTSVLDSPTTTNDDDDTGIFSVGIGVLTADPTTIDNSTISGNGIGVFAFPLGGLIGGASDVRPDAAADTVAITDSTISNNSVVGAAAELYSMSVDNSTLTKNGFAGILSEAAAVTVTRSTVTDAAPSPIDGSVGTDAAAIVTFDIDTAPTTPSFVNPAAIAAAVRKSAATFFGSTNAVGSDAPTATPNAPAPLSTVAIESSIIDGGDQGADCASETDTDITDDGWNLSADADNSCGFSAAKHSLTKTDPKLGALADNGGDTETLLPEAGSHAIDAIPVGAGLCATGAADQRGIARPQDGKCDIGSVEAQLSPVVIHPNSPLPQGTVGKTYKVTITATGGKGYGYVFSLAPGSKLPAGLTLAADGVLSGTPKTAGRFSFTVSVDDPTLKTYAVTIGPAAVPTTPTSTTSSTTSSSGTTSSSTSSSAAPTSASTTQNQAPPLANTGAPIGPLTGIGIATLLAGFGLSGWALTRRRSRTHH